jgi:peptide/nickel transport system substrate-binding protein
MRTVAPPRGGCRVTCAGPTLLAAAAIVAVLTGCAGGAAAPSVRNGGTIAVALPADPASLDPLVADDPVSERAYTPLYPLLYSANSDLSVGPALATALPALSKGATVLTVTLRNDAKWSDGDPITADDVVFTVATEMDPAITARAGARWAGLQAVAKVNPGTVRFTLRAPDAAFVADSLVTPIVPQHAFAHQSVTQILSSAFNDAPTVSGGPFLFDHRVPGQAIYLKANPTFFQGKPHVAQLVETVVHDPAHSVDELESGKLSWAPDLPADQAVPAVSTPGIAVAAYPSTSLVAVVFNVRAGHVFADHAVRLAFASSLDHDALVSQATGNAQGYPVWGDINPNSWAYDAGAVMHYAQSAGRARQALEQDGWSLAGGVASRGSQTLGATLVFAGDDAALAAAASAITQQTSVTGFRLTPQGLSDGAVAQALSGGRFEAALVTLPTGLDPDASAIFATGGARNAGGYSNRSLDALIGDELGAAPAEGQTSQQARKPVFARIEQLVSTDLPCYFLWVPRVFTGFSATLGGVAGTGAQLDADRANSFYRDWYLM